MFWRLGFYPTYQRSETKDAIEAICDRRELRSRVVYEVLGQHDLLLRLWLPYTGKDLPDRDDPNEDRQTLFRRNLLPLDSALRRTLGVHHLSLCDSFLVTKILRHWIFSDQEGQVPALGACAPPSPPVAELRTLNALVETYNTTDDLSKQAPLLRDIAAVPLGQKSGADLFDAKWLVNASFETGIKFAMFVSTAPEISSEFVELRDLTTRLLEMVEGAGAAGILERSLYEGIGFARYLIMGKVREEDFAAITDALINPIVDRPEVTQIYGTHTFTYLATQPDLLSLTEALAVTSDDTLVQPDLTVARPADGDLEADPQGSLPQAAEALLRAVVALLNGDGGTIAFAGDSRVSGTLVDSDIRSGSAASVKGAIERQVVPNPFVQRTILLMTTADDPYGVHEIRVDPGMGQWHYLVPGPERPPEFVVQAGASTEPLWGQDADRWKARDPRLPSRDSSET